jgi:hypothetical protein
MARLTYIDLRSFIEQVDRLGALRRIDGADPYLEIGGITEVAAGLPVGQRDLPESSDILSSTSYIGSTAVGNLSRLTLWPSSTRKSADLTFTFVLSSERDRNGAAHTTHQPRYHRHCAIKPPSITSSAPVMNEASSEARNSTP